MGGASAFVVFLIFAAMYFIPTIIAFLRKHKDAPAIAAINFLLGWSVVGWFISFIWSLSDPRGRAAMQTVVINNTANNNNNTAPPIAAPAAGPIDQDMQFWDSLSDKTNVDSLEEYLMRFPQGRFVALARARLERTQPAPAAKLEQAEAIAAPAVTEADPAQACTTCNAALSPAAKFCEECGTPALASA
ncbi:MAG TPA: superinfection immunity protein [Caulobacteraceae bacterium]|jgi:ribosomal protein L40E